MPDASLTTSATLKTGRLIPEDVWGILCVYAEARGEPYEGQIAVGNVIRNRARRKFFSDGSIVGTVTAPKQFSWMNADDAQRTRCLAATWEAIGSCARAWFESADRQVVGEALWYHADFLKPWWSKTSGIEFLIQIGRHRFYKEAE